MTKVKPMHAVDPTRPAMGAFMRTRCGLIAGENRRTTTPKKVTCKRCRQLAGIGDTWAQSRTRDLVKLRSSPRKEAKRVEPNPSKRAIDALLGAASRMPLSTMTVEVKDDCVNFIASDGGLAFAIKPGADGCSIEVRGVDHYKPGSVTNYTPYLLVAPKCANVVVISSQPY